eukprot:6061242-Pleurochrysis_carterae.AAC.2
MSRAPLSSVRRATTVPIARLTQRRTYKHSVPSVCMHYEHHHCPQCRLPAQQARCSRPRERPTS